MCRSTVRVIDLSDRIKSGALTLEETTSIMRQLALGKPVDKRADVWSFGVVFYEMLMGSYLHKGDSTQEIMAAVLKDEPDLTKVPPQAHRLLKRCLEKDPNKRLRHFGDVISRLDDPPSGSQSAIADQTKAAKTRWLWPAIMAGILAIGILLALWTPWRTSTEHALAEELRSQCSLGFYPKHDMNDRKWHHVQIRARIPGYTSVRARITSAAIPENNENGTRCCQTAS